ncbi:hypothetical protein E2C00_02215 [Streptomyces sp. WAC05374]|uniref:hypothetical protein n=1 Tax=Streptomyces sp. WAC05374 TaxID=2487420 RepID=UPI000F87DA77|nr:hypothetical protein [Streptomyces sp. WAC05374]RST10418.1 hypothetical protein EF905_27375 [Streptomyces sp. WAC05374]TDF50342.1 hypothetical protein E2B92_02190 [Streptomyces sp. WAC05374]TDF58066.1 hypothetical protein E2C02_09980 [Streptomyces sp. WAC05374]TDF60595.1 hypothetical protein E2C00_02215 [Streptomyces sp. WAC05374]
MTTTLTNERVLAVCRANWAYRGIDDVSVREMLAELSAHLDDASAAGRRPQDVVGHDIRAFAASWARARQPLRRRAARLAAVVPFVVGVLMLLSHLLWRTTSLPVTAGRLALLVAVAAVTVTVELRRGALGLGKSWLVAAVVGLPAALAADLLAGDEPLFPMPLWVTALLILPGLPLAVGDARARRRAERSDLGTTVR